MMMVIAGLERPTAGRVVVAGHNLTDLDEDDLATFRRENFGIVFQAFHLIPTMTALENVAIPMELARRGDARGEAERLLGLVGLADRLWHYPGQLSGGEQQRVALARAFGGRPRLLLADEPTGNLDQANGQAVIDLLFDLHAESGTTLLLITHDPVLGGALSADCQNRRRPYRQGGVMTPLSVVVARRELRGSLKGFGIFVACLALGVAAIAGAASLDASLRRSLSEDSRALLGGDAELRLSYRPPKHEESRFLAGFGTLSEAVEMRAMARTADGQRQTLVELKGVDAGYPLYGRLELRPFLGLDQALGRNDGLWGAAVDANLLDRLGARLGDVITVGEAKLVLRAVIEREPDRVSMAFSLGPRLLVDSRVLALTNLLQPGSLVHHALLIRLNRGVAPADFKRSVERRFPDAGWQYRDAAGAAPGIKRFLDQMTLFLTLVGLTALLVGGIGIGNGVKTFLDDRMTSIAILKCLGASRRLIYRVYSLQVAVLAALGIGIGLAIGALLPWAIVAAFGDRLPLVARLGVYPGPLAEAAGFGALTTLAFALWPMARAAAVPAATLFRDIVAGHAYRPNAATLAAILAAGAALAALAIVSAADRRLAAWFVGGSAGVLLLFLAAGVGVVAAARGMARQVGSGGTPVWRLGLSSLYRPGAPTQGVILSLGLGLTLLVMVALVQANLNRQFDERIPAVAPSFFFIDIQPGQTALFDRTVAEAGGEAKRATMVRGRLPASTACRSNGWRSLRMRNGRCAATAVFRRRPLSRPMPAWWPVSGGRPITTARRWSRSMPASPRASASASGSPSPSMCWAAKSPRGWPICATSIGRACR